MHHALRAHRYPAYICSWIAFDYLFMSTSMRIVRQSTLKASTSCSSVCTCVAAVIIGDWTMAIATAAAPAGIYDKISRKYQWPRITRVRLVPGYAGTGWWKSPA